jgi:exopolysaccharide biosynthesis protein
MLALFAKANLHTLVQNGASVAGLDNSQITPRTGIAWTSSLVYLVLVDGVEGQSGLTLQEFALLMNSLSVQFAVNMDGGGSTSGAMHLPDGTFPLINTPSDNNVPGTMRPLGSILGVSW